MLFIAFGSFPPSKHEWTILAWILGHCRSSCAAARLHAGLHPVQVRTGFHDRVGPCLKEEVLPHNLRAGGMGHNPHILKIY